MILKVYSVYDSKAECFGTPFFMGTRGMAIRAFSDLAGDFKSNVSRHPEDYSLFEIGEFDDSKGSIECGVAPTNLGLASSFLPRGTETERMIRTVKDTVNA